MAGNPRMAGGFSDLPRSTERDRMPLANRPANATFSGDSMVAGLIRAL
jgi:hypothetical protein